MLYIYILKVRLPNRVVSTTVSIPAAARSKAWVCGRSLAGILGSNPAGGTDVCFL
jgi:hypothetical protein